MAKPEIEHTPIAKIKQAISDIDHGDINLKIKVYERQAGRLTIEKTERIHITETSDLLDSWNSLMRKISELINQGGSGQIGTQFNYRKGKLQSIEIIYDESL